MDKELFGTKLGSAIQVHRIDRFVSAERKNLLHALIDGGINDVLGADDIRLNCLKRVILASRHLLEGRRVDHDVHAMKRPLHPIQVAHVSDKIANRHRAVLRKHLPHFMLLEFIAAEDDQLLWVEFFENNLGKLFSKRTSSTGHEHDLVIPTHDSLAGCWTWKSVSNFLGNPACNAGQPSDILLKRHCVPKRIRIHHCFSAEAEF